MRFRKTGKTLLSIISLNYGIDNVAKQQVFGSFPRDIWSQRGRCFYVHVQIETFSLIDKRSIWRYSFQYCHQINAMDALWKTRDQHMWRWFVYENLCVFHRFFFSFLFSGNRMTLIILYVNQKVERTGHFTSYIGQFIEEISFDESTIFREIFYCFVIGRHGT